MGSFQQQQPTRPTVRTAHEQKRAHGSLANWHPHLYLLVTDGGLRADGNFVPLPLHYVTTITESFDKDPGSQRPMDGH